MDISYKDITIVGVILGWVGSIVALWTNFKNSIKKNKDDIKEINQLLYNENHELNVITESKFNDHKLYMFKKIDSFKKIADDCAKCQRNVDNKFHEIEISLNTIMVHFDIEPLNKIVLSERRKGIL